MIVRKKKRVENHWPTEMFHMHTGRYLQERSKPHCFNIVQTWTGYNYPSTVQWINCNITKLWNTTGQWRGTNSRRTLPHGSCSQYWAKEAKHERLLEHNSIYKSSKSGKWNCIISGSIHQTRAVKKSREITTTKLRRAVTARAMIREANMRGVKGNVIFFLTWVFIW